MLLRYCRRGSASDHSVDPADHNDDFARNACANNHHHHDDGHGAANARSNNFHNDDDRPGAANSRADRVNHDAKYIHYVTFDGGSGHSRNGCHARSKLDYHDYDEHD